jgi:hypothetical protein
VHDAGPDRADHPDLLRRGRDRSASRGGRRREVGLLAEEFEPWLEALESGCAQARRAYEAGPGGPRALIVDLLASIGLHSSVDAVLRVDRRVQEGIPRAHGKDAFGPPDTLPPADADTAPTCLYSADERSWHSTSPRPKRHSGQRQRCE